MVVCAITAVLFDVQIVNLHRPIDQTRRDQCSGDGVAAFRQNAG